MIRDSDKLAIFDLFTALFYGISVFVIWLWILNVGAKELFELNYRKLIHNGNW
jgi:hypothetical protein